MGMNGARVAIFFLLLCSLELLKKKKKVEIVIGKAFHSMPFKVQQ